MTDVSIRTGPLDRVSMKDCDLVCTITFYCLSNELSGVCCFPNEEETASCFAATNQADRCSKLL